MLLEFLVLLSALLAWAAFPPLGWGWLAPLALAPLLAAMRRAYTRRGAAFLGFAFGFVFYGALTFWLSIIGVYVAIAMAVVMGLFTATFAAALWSARDWEPVPWALTATGLWAAMELLRARFPWGGFRWGDLGYALADVPWFRYAAEFIGTSGLTVVSVSLSAGLAVLVADRKQPWHPLAGSVVLAAVVALAGAASLDHGQGEQLRVVVVQGSTPCPGTHCPNENIETFERHLAMTQTLMPNRFDLVVWAESSAQYEGDPITNPNLQEQVAEEARRLNSFFLIGSSRLVSNEEWINANIVFDRDGNLVGEYQKQHPVPFGEWVPFRDFFDFIPDISRVPRDMVSGAGPVVFDLDGFGMGTVISFEGGFAREPRGAVRAGAQFLVIATNESTYLETAAADQFIRMTRMRASENGIPVVHAAITGPSVLVDANGNMGEPTAIMSAGELTGTIVPRTEAPTLYTRWGEWLAYAAVLGALATVILERRRVSIAATEGSSREDVEAFT